MISVDNMSAEVRDSKAILDIVLGNRIGVAYMVQGGRVPCFCRLSEWSSAIGEAIGIFVRDRKTLIAALECTPQMPMGVAGGTLGGCTQYATYAAAASDMDGLARTAEIVAATNNNKTWLAGYVDSLDAKGLVNLKWHVPSLGEALMIYENLPLINYARGHLGLPRIDFNIRTSSVFAKTGYGSARITLSLGSVGWGGISTADRTIPVMDVLNREVLL